MQRVGKRPNRNFFVQRSKRREVHGVQLRFGRWVHRKKRDRAAVSAERGTGVQSRVVRNLGIAADLQRLRAGVRGVKLLGVIGGSLEQPLPLKV